MLNLSGAKSIRLQVQVTYPALQICIIQMQLGNLNNYGYDRMMMDLLTGGNFSPNLKYQIYYSKYLWRDGLKIGLMFYLS